jgi:hypothetical protein
MNGKKKKHVASLNSNSPDMPLEQNGTERLFLPDAKWAERDGKIEPSQSEASYGRWSSNSCGLNGRYQKICKKRRAQGGRPGFNVAEVEM